jgi:hypothetical protein
MARIGTLALALFLAGCTGPREPVAATDRGEPAADRPPQDPKSTLARPDPALMHYDPASRTLTLYDLPDRDAQWMVATPENPLGEPVGAIHAFPDEVDVDRTAVFYTTTGGRPSPRVTLREVLTGERQAKVN